MATAPNHGMTTNIVYETGRLVLRQFRDDDLDALFAVIGDPITMQYYPHTFTRKDAEEWLGRNLRRYALHGYGLFAVVLKTTGEMIGDCGLVQQQIEGLSLLEVGYHLRRDQWGKGYATEAARATMGYAFQTLNVAKLISLIRPDNLPSRRVAERNGMKIEQQITFYGLPHLVYAMRRQDYGQA
jgi:RimJ/RimL family protein N-acetyltransferase